MKKYFHISKRYLGETVILKPKVPELCDINTEGNIPRICVSDKIFKCVCSIISSYPFRISDVLNEFRQDLEAFESKEEYSDRITIIKSPSIYYTEEIPFLPPKVSDFRNNNEHWFLQDTEFRLYGFIDFLELVRTKRLSISKTQTEIDSKLLLSEEFKNIWLYKRQHNF